MYTPLCGEVVFECISDSIVYPIATTDSHNSQKSFSKECFYYDNTDAECLLFPSAEQRDWRKFKAPWYKKELFNPETLAHFDKVLVRDTRDRPWICAIFSHVIKEDENITFKYQTTGGAYVYCIPYNEDTACLVGTKDEPSEFYRHWED